MEVSYSCTYRGTLGFPGLDWGGRSFFNSFFASVFGWFFDGFGIDFG